MSLVLTYQRFVEFFSPSHFSTNFNSGSIIRIMCPYGGPMVMALKTFILLTFPLIAGDILHNLK